MAQTSNLSATLSSTFMPYFDANRSASASSTNTRQREDFEESDNNNTSRTQLAFTSAFGETKHDGCQDLNSSTTFYRIPACVASYPASELPFASEPALETELETELPPLKKLRSSRLGSQDDSLFEQVDAASEKSRVILIKVVKSILTKRDSCATTTTSPPPSTNLIDPSRLAWHAAAHPSAGLAAPVSLASLVDGSSRPLSRRPSSCASATSTQSIKAVRFASGNGFFPTCEHSGLGVHHQQAEDGTRCCRPAELEGPVAAVMYLTHSAHAYDRSPIVVEQSLRMPPRRDAEECGRWVISHNEEAVLEDGCSRPAQNLKPTEKEVKGELALTRTHTTSSSEADERWTSFSSELQKHFLQLRDQPASSHHEDQEQDQGDQSGYGDDDQQTQVADDDDEEEEVDDLVGRDGRNGRMFCGLGKWSSGEVLNFDDVLGGF